MQNEYAIGDFLKINMNKTEYQWARAPSSHESLKQGKRRGTRLHMAAEVGVMPSAVL